MFERFYRLHDGEVCVLALNGISLKDVPLAFLKRYPSFGCNTIFKREDFTPNYYAAVDDRNHEVHGEPIARRFGDVPKFIPTPNLDKWQGVNFWRFKHHEGPVWKVRPHEWTVYTMDEVGLHYGHTPQVLMQLAFFMGFQTILIVGMDHKPYADGYFWGVDEPILDRRSDDVRFRVWDKGYRAILEGFGEAGVRMLNLTPDSLAEAIPHDEMKNW